MRIRETNNIKRPLTREEYIAIIAHINTPANKIINTVLTDIGYIDGTFDDDLNMYSDHPHGNATFFKSEERNATREEEIAYNCIKLNNLINSSKVCDMVYVYITPSCNIEIGRASCRERV